MSRSTSANASYGEVLGALTRIFVSSVEMFYAERASHRPAKTGAVGGGVRTF